MPDLAQVTEHIRGAVGDNSGLGKTVKLDLGDQGKIFIDGASTPNTVTNEDKPADERERLRGGRRRKRGCPRRPRRGRR